MSKSWVNDKPTPALHTSVMRAIWMRMRCTSHSPRLDFDRLQEAAPLTYLTVKGAADDALDAVWRMENHHP